MKGKRGNPKNSLSRLVIILTLVIALLIFVGAVSYSVVYTDTNNAIEGINLRIRLSASVLFVYFNELNKEAFINSFLLYKL